MSISMRFHFLGIPENIFQVRHVGKNGKKLVFLDDVIHPHHLWLMSGEQNPPGAEARQAVAAATGGCTSGCGGCGGR